MKIILLLVLLISANLAVAQTTSISDNRPVADIQVQFLDSQGNWHRLQKIPNHEYPFNLLNEQGKGCAITSFNITTSGRVNNIEIEDTAPNRYGIHLHTATRQLIRNWRWPEQEQQSKLTMRFDYCLESDQTREQVIQQCITQSEQVCT